MKIFSWLSCILVAVTAVTAENTKVPPTELQIETTFKPDSCPRQAQKKDYIHVHYVSRSGVGGGGRGGTTNYFYFISLIFN